jgi:NTP pyrophosphatase (non-canonical NTP hydrolase)
MSEYLNNQKRGLKAYDYCTCIINADNARKHITDNQDIIESITAEETLEVLDILLQEDIPFETIKDNTGKL